MLTPSQIAGFESRADNGEEPLGPWRFSEEKGVHFLGPDGTDIIWVSVGWDVPFATAWLIGLGSDRSAFSSIPAAKLAAEHLIRENWRPLYQREPGPGASDE